MDRQRYIPYLYSTNTGTVPVPVRTVPVNTRSPHARSYLFTRTASSCIVTHFADQRPFFGLLSNRELVYCDPFCR